MHRYRGDIENNLTVFDIVLRNLYILSIGIDQYVGRAVVFEYPLVECAKQIRPA
jgi:hypothetical protein